MITIITGTPGAGKTLYTVTKLLQALVGTTVKHVVDGVEVEMPRTIYTNINGFMLDHEKCDAGGTWEFDVKVKAWKFEGLPGGFRDWHTWAKPGSVIVVDEAQKFWTPRANGAPVPPDIQGLETHRHMGVDFIVITQGLALLERNFQMLCNRHLHVRRVANLPFAVVYEWDHASKTLAYSKALTNSKWWYDKKAYRLYKSAEVHTKQPRGIPKALIVAILGVLACGVLVPWTYTRFGERFGWIEAPKVSAEVKKDAGGGGKPPVAPSNAGTATPVALVDEKRPQFVGCVATTKRCTCYDSVGAPVDKGPGFCQVHTEGMSGPPIALDRLVIPEQEQHQRELAALDRPDSELIAFAAARERAPGGPHALPGKALQLQSKSPERSAGGGE